MPSELNALQGNPAVSDNSSCPVPTYPALGRYAREDAMRSAVGPLYDQATGFQPSASPSAPSSAAQMQGMTRSAETLTSGAHQARQTAKSSQGAQQQQTRGEESDYAGQERRSGNWYSGYWSPYSEGSESFLWWWRKATNSIDTPLTAATSLALIFWDKISSLGGCLIGAGFCFDL